MSFVFDPYSYTTFQPNAWAIYSELREGYRVYRNPERGFWALSRFDDVQAAARDWQTFSSAEGVNLDDVAEVEGPGNFLDMDPPRHDLLRKVVQGWFTPRHVHMLEPEIRATAKELVDALVSRGSGDVARELAWELPTRTIARMLGLPPSDFPELADWAQRLIVRESGKLRVPDSVRQLGKQLHACFLAAIDERRDQPADDIMSRLAVASIDGMPLGDEVLGISMVLLGAATETTASLIAHCVLVLAEHPDVRLMLLRERELLEPAIEEILRFVSPVPFVARTTTAPVDVGGRTIPAGARVLLVYAAANRDPRRWPEPDHLDIRRPSQRSLAFGVGIHHCLGAVLARMEGRVALDEVLTSMPDYSLMGPAVRCPTYTTPATIAALPIVARCDRSRMATRVAGI